MRTPDLFVSLAASLVIFCSSSYLPATRDNNKLIITTWLKSEIAHGYQGEVPVGNALYKKYCLTCHQADGSGVHGMFPPLAGNEKITGPATELIKIVLFGLTGPVTVNGRDYNQPMPAQGTLSDKQISDILSYIRNSWGNKASPVTADQVQKVRKKGK